LPAAVKPALRPPGDVDRAWVAALLAAAEFVEDVGAVAVVPGGLDQESAGVL
jgi:hypothetical protein